MEIFLTCLTLFLLLLLYLYLFSARGKARQRAFGCCAALAACGGDWAARGAPAAAALAGWMKAAVCPALRPSAEVMVGQQVTSARGQHRQEAAARPRWQWLNAGRRGTGCCPQPFVDRRRTIHRAVVCNSWLVLLLCLRSMVLRCGRDAVGCSCQSRFGCGTTASGLAVKQMGLRWAGARPPVTFWARWATERSAGAAAMA